jgi:3'-phosphoadenosine 5'-phosphosulfate sulfotransferase (PAPS reductase)/FAD synthetase
MPSFIQANGLECQIDGTRRDEATRNEKSTDLIVDGENVSRENMPAFVKRGIFGLSMLYPIFNWTEQQVWEYLKYNGIKVSKEYTE